MFIFRNEDMLASSNNGLICPEEEGNIKLGVQCLRLEINPLSFSDAQQYCSVSSGFINPPQGLIQAEILRKVLN